MADSSKSTGILLALIAAVVGYAGWSGDGINYLGLSGLHTRVERVDSLQDTLARTRARVDSAKADLARESIDDLKARVAAYQAQLSTLRSLVPAQREIADLLDDISIRAKAQGVTLSTAITPYNPTPGPGPFETNAYQMSVIGHYHQVGRFLTDVASLRRIIVPQEINMKSAPMERARVLGDTTAMLEVDFVVRTYVKPGTDKGEQP